MSRIRTAWTRAHAIGWGLMFLIVLGLYSFALVGMYVWWPY
jgi:hypothetical protein